MPLASRLCSILCRGLCKGNCKEYLLSKKRSNVQDTISKEKEPCNIKSSVPLSGSCMCGAIKFQSTDKPEFNALCHCIDCQKWTGGAFTSNSVVSEDSFTVTKGIPKMYDVIGDSGKPNSHYFCGACGSSLFTRAEILEGKVLIKAGGLNNGSAGLDNNIAIELYTKDRVTYLSAVKGAKQAERMS